MTGAIHTLFSRSSFSSVSCRPDSSLSRERCSVLLLFSSPSSACWVSCSLSSRDFLSRLSCGTSRNVKCVCVCVEGEGEGEGEGEIHVYSIRGQVSTYMFM